MAAYDDFFPWVLPEVPGCPEIAAVQAIRDSTIEFCQKSLLFQVDHDPITVIQKIADYDLESPVTGARVEKVMKAWYKGKQLIPTAPDEVRDPSVYNQRIGDYKTEYSTPKYFIQKDSNSISLLPIPDQSLQQAITMRVALAPLRSSTECADFLFEQWAETIGSGAIARLQSSVGKAYYNFQSAAIHQAKYMVGINAARMKANRGYNRSNLSVQLRKI